MVLCPLNHMTRLLVISDLHCGHEVGLTAPSHDITKGRLARFSPMRKTIYKWAVKTIDSLRPIDVLLVNGDAIDGRGDKSGGLEQIELDMGEQVDMASQFIKLIKPRHTILSYGTSYHTGAYRDFENDIAKKVDAEKIGSEDNIEILGNVINYRHHLGRSAIPHGRVTAVLRERLWNEEWAARGEYPRANIIIRSHVHYHYFGGNTDFLALTTPALQGYGTKYGTRRVSGTVDIGMVVFDVRGPKDYTWHAPILRLKLHKPLRLR